MRTVPTKSNLALQQLVERILGTGQMTRQEHLHLTSMLLATSRMPESDRSQVNRVFDHLQAGRLKIVD